MSGHGGRSDVCGEEWVMTLSKCNMFDGRFR